MQKQEVQIPAITGKFGLKVQKKQDKGKQSFAEKTHQSSSNNTRNDSTYGHHQMVNTQIRLTIFLTVKDGETL